MKQALCAAFVLAACTVGARAAKAEPAPTPVPSRALLLEVPDDLQAPQARDRRNSAYSLPANTWAFGVGVLGIGGGDAYANLNLAYGFGAGIETQINLAHASVGLLNLGAYWQFVDTHHFALAARAAFWYGHGDWIWIAQGPSKSLISNLDAIGIPVLLAASAPVAPWLQFDLDLGYRHGEVFGTVTNDRALFLDAQLGVRQVIVRSGARFFLTKTTEFDISGSLPPYTALPVDTTTRRDDERSGYRTVSFSEAWSLEFGVRSRFTRSVFGSFRLHYGEVSRTLYGAPLYPSFDIELRI